MIYRTATLAWIGSPFTFFQLRLLTSTTLRCRPLSLYEKVENELFYHHNKAANHNVRDPDELGINKDQWICRRAQFKQHIQDERYKNGEIDDQRVAVTVDIYGADQYSKYA